MVCRRRSARPPGVRAIVAGAIVLKSEIERPIVAGSQTNWPIVRGHAPIVRGSIVMPHYYSNY